MINRAVAAGLWCCAVLAAPSPFIWQRALRCYSASCVRASCCPPGPLELHGQQCPSVCPPAPLTSPALHWGAWCWMNQCCCRVTSCLATSRATSCRIFCSSGTAVYMPCLGRQGSTEALGMTKEALCVWEIALLRSGCLLKFCFNSIPKRSWQVAWWVGVKCSSLNCQAILFLFVLRTRMGCLLSCSVSILTSVEGNHSYWRLDLA